LRHVSDQPSGPVLRQCSGWATGLLQGVGQTDRRWRITRPAHGI